MPFVYGILGALIANVLFFGGAFVGWKAHGRFYRTTPREPTQREKDELKAQAEQQRQWREMSNYNADVAYGVGAIPVSGGEAGELG